MPFQRTYIAIARGSLKDIHELANAIQEKVEKLLPGEEIAMKIANLSDIESGWHLSIESHEVEGTLLLIKKNRKMKKIAKKLEWVRSGPLERVS